MTTVWVGMPPNRYVDGAVQTIQPPTTYPATFETDATNRSRIATVVDGTLRTFNCASNLEWTYQHTVPFVRVESVSQDWVLVTTATALWLVLCTLPVTVCVNVWEFGDPATTFWGIASSKTMFHAWVESATFNGLLCLPLIGILRMDAIAPVLYPSGRPIAPVTEQYMEDIFLLPHLPHVRGGEVPKTIGQSRRYAGPGRSTHKRVTAAVFRSGGVSGLLVVGSDVFSFRVGLDKRLVPGDAHESKTLATQRAIRLPAAVQSIAVLENSDGSEFVACAVPGTIYIVHLQPKVADMLTLDFFDIGGSACVRVEIESTAVCRLEYHNSSLFAITDEVVRAIEHVATYP
jgi:hypothetical protein